MKIFLRPAKLDWKRVGELLVDAVQPVAGFFLHGRDDFFGADRVGEDLFDGGESHEAGEAFVAAAAGAGVDDAAFAVLATRAGHALRRTCQAMWQSLRASM